MPKQILCAVVHISCEMFHQVNTTIEKLSRCAGCTEANKFFFNSYFRMLKRYKKKEKHTEKT